MEIASAVLFLAAIALTWRLLIVARQRDRYTQQTNILTERCQQIPRLEKELQEKQVEYRALFEELVELKEDAAARIAQFSEEQKHAQEKIDFLFQAQEMLTNTFKAVSADTLQTTQKSFLEVAKQTFEKYHQGMQSELQQRHSVMQELVKPIRESLEKVDTKIADIEKVRLSAYTGVTEQLRLVALSHAELQKETSRLVNALHTPSARGKWGEVQLQRVVEMAGMVEYCDFVTQETFGFQDARMRPDMIVKLPNSRCIVIDAKAPLQAYLESIETREEESRIERLKEHAKQLRKHIVTLSDKSYWDAFQPSPEFVVLFLPGESFFSAALQYDPSLVEMGVEKKVLLATPTTLIALLKAIAHGWQEKTIAENAHAFCDLGKQLYERLKNMADHFLKLKRSLDASVDSYNKAMGSFENRVLVTARKFHDLGITETDEAMLVEPVEKMCRVPITEES